MSPTAEMQIFHIFNSVCPQNTCVHELNFNVQKTCKEMLKSLNRLNEISDQIFYHTTDIQGDNSLS